MRSRRSRLRSKRVFFLAIRSSPTLLFLLHLLLSHSPHSSHFSPPLKFACSSPEASQDLSASHPEEAAPPALSRCEFGRTRRKEKTSTISMMRLSIALSLFPHRNLFSPLLSLLFLPSRSAPNKRPHPFFIAAGLKVDGDGGNGR